YHYGFPSEIGAGPYDRRSGTLHAPATGVDAGMPGTGPIATPASGILTLNHSMTWRGASNTIVDGELVIQAGNHQRPVLRFCPGASWTLTGGRSSTLVLDGLLISGTDVVLAGDFDTVTISCCTLDPGSAAARAGVVGEDAATSPPQSIIALAVDGRELTPT